MNIVFLTPEYPPRPSGGIGTATRNLAHGLVAAGHDVWVVSLGPEKRLVDGGAQVCFLDVDHPRGLGWFVVRRALGREIKSLVAGEGIDLVVAPDWLGISAGLRPGCPIAISCNGSATYFGDLLGEPVRRSVRLAERIALRGADSVSAVSAFTAQRSQELFALDRTPTVLTNAVDLTRYPEHSPVAEPGLIVHVGTLVRKKGVFDLTDAFSRVVEACPRARLVVAGPDAPDGRTGAASTWDLAATGLSTEAAARVDRIGRVANDDIPALLGRGALCLFPSHAEANPVAWIEAMAAGRAIVGYAHGWATEVVDHGVTGWLVPPGDIAALAAAVVDALADPERLRAVGDRARAEAERRFSIRTMVDENVGWFETMVQR